MQKETWQSYLKSERQKDSQRKSQKEKRRQSVNTKRFWSKQSFGAASEVRNVKV